MNKKRNILIGLVLVFTIITFFLGFNFLKGEDLFSSKTKLYATYENIDGLEKSDLVTIKGFKIGNVTEIYFSDVRASKLIVEFEVDRNYEIPRNTIAQINTTDLMGDRSLNLILGEGEMAKEGDTLRSALTEGLKEQVSQQVLPLKIKAESLIGSMDSLVVSFQTILNSESQGNLISSIQNIKKTLSNLERASGGLDHLITAEKSKISDILTNLAELSHLLKNNSSNMDNILTNFSSLSDSLAQTDLKATLNQAQQATEDLAQMLDKVNKGEGTIGSLLNDDELYTHFAQAAENLERLVADLKQNPKRYVRFSVLNTGRNVYYDSEALEASKKSLYYRVFVYHASQPVSLDNEIFKGRTDIDEQKQDDGTYLYTIGHTTDFKQLSKELKKIKKDFPKAYILEE